MIEVYSSPITMESQLVAQLLTQHDLHPFLRNENLASMVGIGSQALPCVVLVPETEIERARAILEDHFSRKNENE